MSDFTLICLVFLIGLSLFALSLCRFGKGE
jgi:hypothetical protein